MLRLPVEVNSRHLPRWVAQLGSAQTCSAPTRRQALTAIRACASLVQAENHAAERGDLTSREEEELAGLIRKYMGEWTVAAF